MTHGFAVTHGLWLDKARAPVNDGEVTRTQHRGVPIVTPQGETIEALVDSIDETGAGRKLLAALEGPAREVLRAVVAGAYVAGMRDGVDRALAASTPIVTPESAVGDALPQPIGDLMTSSARGGRGPVQFVVEKFRTSELTLPSLPEATQQLNRLLANPEHDILQVIEVVRREPAMTARVMHVASSPYYAANGRAPRTLQEAAVRLGARELSRQLLAFSNKRLFAFKCKRREAQLRDVWHHALATALVAEELARDLEGANPASFFLHGLLHDIGRAVLLQIFDELEAEQPERFSGDEVERTMDAVHGQFGSAVLQRWRFDEAFVEVALFHHQPQKSFGHMRAVAAVALADAIVCQAGFGDEHAGYAGVPLDAHPSALFLNLPPERLKAVFDGVKRQMEAMSELM